jgi:hypothetical protein
VAICHGRDPRRGRRSSSRLGVTTTSLRCPSRR